MEKDELGQLKYEFKKLFGKAFTVASSECVRDNFIYNIDKFNSFESPDMYLKKDNEVIGIEVFEFSSYKTTKKKGNMIKLKEEEISYNNLNLYISSNQNYFSTEVETIMNLQEYEKSFIDAFEKHYNKIDKYKEHLSIYSNNVKIYFLVKDITVYGNTIEYNGEPQYYYPLMNENIINHLRNKTDVEGIIFQCEAIDNKKVYFYFENTEDNINEIYDENKCFFNIELDRDNFIKKESFYDGGINE